MLAADRTVHHRGARSLGDGPRRADPDRAVDDRHAGSETLDIAGGLADKVLDLEGVADVHDVDTLDSLGRRRNVESHGLVARGGELEERAPDLSEPDDDDGRSAAHDRYPCVGSSSRIRRWLAPVDSSTQVATRSCCSGESPGNIGSESTWDAACSATGKWPGLKTRVSLAFTRRSGSVSRITVPSPGW